MTWMVNKNEEYLQTTWWDPTLFRGSSMKGTIEKELSLLRQAVIYLVAWWSLYVLRVWQTPACTSVSDGSLEKECITQGKCTRVRSMSSPRCICHRHFTSSYFELTPIFFFSIFQWFLCICLNRLRKYAMKIGSIFYTRSESTRTNCASGLMLADKFHYVSIPNVHTSAFVPGQLQVSPKENNHVNLWKKLLKQPWFPLEKCIPSLPLHSISNPVNAHCLWAWSLPPPPFSPEISYRSSLLEQKLCENHIKHLLHGHIKGHSKCWKDDF